jgi:hypothetical protein
MAESPAEERRGGPAAPQLRLDELLEGLQAQVAQFPEPVSDTDARLAYVAVTRARHHLDLGGLSWINTHPTTPSAG